MPRPTNNLLWLLAYLATMAALVSGLAYVRDRTVADLSRPENLVQWQRWKNETQRQSGEANSGPVQRKPVKSDEPPALILLRDYFAAILGVALLVGSFLFGFFMVVGRGVWAAGRTRTQAKTAEAPPP